MSLSIPTTKTSVKPQIRHQSPYKIAIIGLLIYIIEIDLYVKQRSITSTLHTMSKNQF